MGAYLPIGDFLRGCSRRIDYHLEIFVKGRFWWLKSWMVLVLICLSFNSPVKKIWTEHTWRHDYLNALISEPLTPHNIFKLREATQESYKKRLDSLGVEEAFDGYYDEALLYDVKYDAHTSHLEKFGTRLTIPFIGYILGMDWRVYPLVGGLSGLLLFLVILLIAEREFKRRLVALYLALSFVLCWPGLSTFGDVNAKGDLLAWLFLMLGIYWKRPILIALTVGLAGFTDERAIIASGFVFVYWWIKSRDEIEILEKKKHAIRAIAVILGFALNLAARGILYLVFNIKNGGSMMFEPSVVIGVFNMIMDREYPKLLLSVFEMLILWIPLLGYALWLKKDWWVASALAFTSLVLLVATSVVWDLERSLCYFIAIFPIAWHLVRFDPTTLLHFARFGAVFGIVWTVPSHTCLQYFVPALKKVLSMS